MTPSITIGRRVSADDGCYVIAEAGSNHDGVLEQALSLVDAAAGAGADAVKFQLFRAAEMYPSNCGLVETPTGAVDFFDLLSACELPTAWLPMLAERAKQRGIDFLCSPFDADAADAVASVGVPALKIASPELTHLPFLRHVASLGLPVILSTGLASLGDVEEALGVLRESGADEIALLHCVTAYPAPPSDCNLNALEVLRSAFDVPVGFSDHTMSPTDAPSVAVALGAAIIEKHFTLSRTLRGPDHPFALEPDELAALVTAVREVSSLPLSERVALVEDRLGTRVVAELRGESRKTVALSEAPLASHDRRSLHAVVDIPAGAQLSEANMAIQRGERNLRPGLHPRYLPVVEGARTRRPVQRGDGIVWDDILDRS